MKSGAILLVVVTLLMTQVVFSADSPTPASKPDFTEPAAKEAQASHDAAVATAWEAYQEQLRKVDQIYIEALKLAFANAMKAEKLEEALKIKKEIEVYQVDVKAGMVLYYDFDQTPVSGLVKDLSGQNNHGKTTGAKWDPTGRFGGAIKFNISNKTDSLVVSDSDSLDVKQVTLSVWINTTANDEYWNRIVDKDFRNGYTLGVGGDYQGKPFRDKVYFECNGKAIGSNGSVIDGKWHHIVAIYDGSEMRMVIDGQKQKAVSKWSGALAANKFEMAVGNSKIPYEPSEFLAFDGLIDELRIYNRPLTEKEIHFLYTTQGK